MRENAWKGFKNFIVYDKVQEDENVTSFYLKLEDNEPLPKAIPGQFIAVKIPKKDNKFSKVRQYTLSMDPEEDFYRISVKIEEEGEVSIDLCRNVQVGDVLLATAPMGKFVLKDNNNTKVLIGGGIGITPMLSMAYATKGTDTKVKLIYSTQNSRYHSFKEEIEKLRDESPNIDFTLVYTRPTEEDKAKGDFDIEGRIDKEWMEKNLTRDGEFYFCGPVPFMRAMYKGLESIGIDKEKINYELFVSGEDITK
ncbi:FAD-binding oxidoreductase [Clostridium sp. DSM 8431]|uniref:FAD-binding oxidoreductase n=1 Tax=Clostridium sp. DSM 8431 TaxID=1761781 RepID=UPI001FA929F2|nr:FAD-binding oxidoreductase [Clostridium sp. DSM 8431]